MGRSERGLQVRKEAARRHYQLHKVEKKARDHQRYLKDPEKQVEHNRQWRAANREKYNANAREKRKEYSFYGTERFNLCRRLGYINSRCNNPNFKGYKNYGGRGIKNFLTLDDLEFLWKRDSAADMVKASLHRINNDGDYSLKNCQYLELKEHAKLNRRRNIKKDLTVNST